MKITALTQGQNIPSRRFRWKQYEQVLAGHGIDCCELYAKHNSYPTLNGNYQKIKWLLNASFDSGNRIRIANSSDCNLVFLQRNLISDLLTFETFIKKPYIYDVDDAIYLNKYGNFCHHIAKRSVATICGNTYIANYFSSFSNIEILPTAIDTNFYAVAKERYLDKKIIGWVGTSSNFPNLYSAEEALKAVLDKFPNSSLLIVSDTPPSFRTLPGTRVAFRKWNPIAEIEAISSFTVGIMPLIDNHFSKGKCSYKMLSYMSIGVPVVVSNVGMNVEILTEGHVGFGCTTRDEWVDAISYLLSSVNDNFTMGNNGARLIRRKYSSAVIGKKLADIFKKYAY